MLAENILEIKNLSVEVSGNKLLENVNLSIPKGEVHILFGPNGSGKSSLIMTILGFPSYTITSGEIWFKGKNITNLPVNERVKLGINVAFQNPPAIRGVKLGGIMNSLLASRDEVGKLIDKVKFPPEFLERDVNLGFSGGEIKKSEVLQMLAQGGDFVMLDEPDSGVDVENLQLVGGVINEMLKERSALIITHLGYILRYVNADRAHVLINGTVACSDDPIKVLGQILNGGYAWCMKCPKVRKTRRKQGINLLH
ncbi:MAG: ABC transporter ATP-binding protein [Candidatus Bathyarchaeota archaeon]|nr:ABC transporter ATP-binding protein [Candidatus Bathyarchaeota archaeon]